MLIQTCSASTQLTATQIWDKYVDVPNWKSWDTTVESSSINGEFVEGTKGLIKPKDAPQIEFEITTLTKYIFFRTTAKLPLAHIDFDHTIVDDGANIIITHSIHINGFLSPLYKVLMSKTLSKGLDQTLMNLSK
jgi:hypothetical protein